MPGCRAPLLSGGSAKRTAPTCCLPVPWPGSLAIRPHTAQPFQLTFSYPFMSQEVWGLLEARVCESCRQGSHSPQPSAQSLGFLKLQALGVCLLCSRQAFPQKCNPLPLCPNTQVSLPFSHSLFPPSLGHRSSHQTRSFPGDDELTCASVAFLGKWPESKTQCLGFGFPHPVSCHNETDVHRIFIKPAGAFSLIVFLKNSS